MVAAGCGFPSGLSLLLRRGGRVNRRTLGPDTEAAGSPSSGPPGGWQALHFAAAAGEEECCRHEHWKITLFFMLNLILFPH